MTTSNEESEVFLFKKIVENIQYLDNKNVKTTQMFKWASELRLAGSQFGPGAVRNWVNNTYRLLKKGQFPSIVQGDDELIGLGMAALRNLGRMPYRPVIRRPAVAGQNAAGLPDDTKHRHYSAAEQEHLFIRLAGRIDDVTGTKQQKSKFFNDMASELAEMGFNRNARSIQRWVTSLREGKWPAVAGKESLSWAVDAISEVFQPGLFYADSAGDDLMDFEDSDSSATPPPLGSKIDRSASEEATEGADSRGSCDSGVGGVQDQPSGAVDTSPMTLDMILKQLEQNFSKETIKCKPLSYGGSTSPRRSPSPPPRCLAMTEVVDKVLENCNMKIQKLEAVRARKELVDEEVSKQKKVLRVLKEQAFLEAQEIRQLEKEIGRMQSYINDTMNAPDYTPSLLP